MYLFIYLYVLTIIYVYADLYIHLTQFWQLFYKHVLQNATVICKVF